MLRRNIVFLQSQRRVRLDRRFNNDGTRGCTLGAARELLAIDVKTVLGPRNKVLPPSADRDHRTHPQGTAKEQRFDRKRPGPAGQSGCDVGGLGLRRCDNGSESFSCECALLTRPAAEPEETTNKRLRRCERYRSCPSPSTTRPNKTACAPECAGREYARPSAAGQAFPGQWEQNGCIGPGHFANGGQVSQPAHPVRQSIVLRQLRSQPWVSLGLESAQ